MRGAGSQLVKWSGLAATRRGEAFPVQWHGTGGAARQEIIGVGGASKLGKNTHIFFRNLVCNMLLYTSYYFDLLGINIYIYILRLDLCFPFWMFSTLLILGAQNEIRTQWKPKHQPGKDGEVYVTEDAVPPLCHGNGRFLVHHWFWCLLGGQSCWPTDLKSN